MPSLDFPQSTADHSLVVKRDEGKRFSAETRRKRKPMSIGRYRDVSPRRRHLRTIRISDVHHRFPVRRLRPSETVDGRDAFTDGWLVAWERRARGPRGLEESIALLPSTEWKADGRARIYVLGVAAPRRPLSDSANAITSARVPRRTARKVQRVETRCGSKETQSSKMGNVRQRKRFVHASPPPMMTIAYFPPLPQNFFRKVSVDLSSQSLAAYVSLMILLIFNVILCPCQSRSEYLLVSRFSLFGQLSVFVSLLSLRTFSRFDHRGALDESFFLLSRGRG